MISNFKILILVAFITFSNCNEELRFLHDNVDIVNDVNVSKDVGVSIHNKVNELKDSDDESFMKGGAGCYRAIDDKSCKNASSSSTCVTFANDYKTGSCARAGYPVECFLRYGVILNYKDQATCDQARKDAGFTTFKQGKDACSRITDNKYCRESTDQSACLEPIYNYKSGSCASHGFAVECTLRYGSILYYKKEAECKAARDKALH